METQAEPPSRISREDLLLHPVRMRIILAAASRQEMTAQQLADDMPDIPQASLYRSINLLTAAGILVVVRERRTRNTIEKTFALRSDKVMLAQEDLGPARPEDHMRFFTQYLGILMGYYGRYLARQEQVDLARDHVGYNLISFNLTEAEAGGLMKALQEAFVPYMNNEPSPERQRLVLGLVVLPDTPAPRPAPGPEPVPAEAAGEPDLQNLIPAAVLFVSQMAQNDFSSLDIHLEESMRAANSAGQLEQAWGQLCKRAGAFQRQTGVSTRSAAGRRVVDVTCQFETARFAVQLLFDRSGKIAGMRFQPAGLDSSDRTLEP